MFHNIFLLTFEVRLHTFLMLSKNQTSKQMLERNGSLLAYKMFDLETFTDFCIGCFTACLISFQPQEAQIYASTLSPAILDIGPLKRREYADDAEIPYM